LVLDHLVMNEIEKDAKSSEGLAARDHRTRSRLIEAAGIVFSEKGYDRATAREICDLAQASPAAVNYHFGGKEKLYVAVLREAHRRLMNVEALEAIAKDMDDPEEGLAQFFGGLLHSMLDPSPAGWIAKLIMREMSAPTRALDEVIDLQVRPRSLLLRSLIGRMMNLSVDHPAVVRGTLSSVGQFVFLFQNRRVIKSVFPELDLTSAGIDEMARHIWRFTIAGLRAVAQDAKEGCRS
jgi:AcrR family transcriptional regulator